jgi:ribonuclease P protein component
MTPSEAEGKGSNVVAPDSPVTVLSGLRIMAKRADFLRAASARRQSTAGFTLQARARNDDSAEIRIGYTCSKKLGNAVARNRAKRRLRALARQVLPDLAHPGWDYVLVGRPRATAERNFAMLCTDLEGALRQVHRPRTP